MNEKQFLIRNGSWIRAQFICVNSPHKSLTICNINQFFAITISQSKKKTKRRARALQRSFARHKTKSFIRLVLSFDESSDFSRNCFVFNIELQRETKDFIKPHLQVVKSTKWFSQATNFSHKAIKLYSFM